MLFIKNMIETGLTVNGLNYNKMIDYCSKFASDRRFKPFILASTTSGKSGIIKYKGIKYYYYKLNDALNVEVVK